MTLRASLLLLGAALALISACDPNQSGKVQAAQFGARSDVPAPRVRYDEPVREACGEAVPGDDVGLPRAPYLQKLGKDGGEVVWTSISPGPYTLELSRPDGELVGRFPSRAEPTTLLRDATQQSVALTGLSPSTLYCYALRAPDGMLLPQGGLQTAPAPGTGARVSFVAFGDSGWGGSDQHAVFEQIKTVPFDLALVTGDVAYPSGTLGSLERKFFDVYAPILTSVPVFPVTGNHDYKTRDGAPFREAFALPENSGANGQERWYSFDWGDVHFVAIDTQRIDDEQSAWLDSDLAANRLPWVIVFMHKSPYASGAHGSDKDVRARFSPILEFHRVPLVLAGHDHDYERTEVINGVTYVVTGGGGRGTRGVGKSSFTAFSHDVLHFVYVTIEGEDLRLYAIDGTGQEFDFAHIRRPE